MDDTQANQIIARFGKAFFNRDRELLAQAVTEDVQWHFAIGNDYPHGRVRHGVDGFMQGIEENDAMFERLKFLDIECRALSPDEIVMTYLLDGKYRGGNAFSLRGIELIRVRDGKIALKDVFWKQAE
ncbi:MAG: nuclear transport factor 2 family protein [Burkholderiaceae bacterium]